MRLPKLWSGGVIGVLRSFGALFPLLIGRGLNSHGVIQEFTEDEPFEVGFAVHYEKHLKPYVDEFESRRIVALRKARSRLFTILPVMAVALTFGYYALFLNGWHEEAKNAIFPGTVIALVAIVWWVNRSLNAYQASIKSDIFPEIVEFLGDYQFTADIDARINRFKDFGIVPSHDSESSEDRIVGEYKGVHIDLFETRLTETRGSEEDRQTVTVFKGVVISLSMNKRFEGKTIVLKDQGRLVNWVKDKFSNLETVKLEDPRFEKEFEIYSNDQVEARYLLTPSFMNRLSDLRAAFGGKGIECSFFQNNLLMMISIERNMFEPGSIFEREDFIDDAKSLLKEMTTIFQVVDTLQLDLDVGL
jgi:hypothetical protein